jgi:hypothetical protein
VTPVELRVRYGVSDATLRRRRDELARLGVVYVEAGRGSHYRAIAPVFDPDAPPPDVPIAIGDPAPVEHDGRLAFILDELRLQDGRTIRDAAETDPWIVDELLRPVFQTDGDGLPLHRLIYNELARGHGKSLYAAAFALAEATLYPSTEVIVAAADTEQASIILEHIDGFTARSPMLQTLIERAPNVRLFAGRSRVRVIASDAASAWGHGGVYRRFRLILDELTAWKDRGEQLWEALASATGKVADAQTICLGNSGWNADRAWQYKVRETAEREPWARLFSPEGTLASWISRKWLDQQRSLLPPASFERLHLNRWISQEGDFVSAQQPDGDSVGSSERAASRMGTGAGRCAAPVASDAARSASCGGVEADQRRSRSGHGGGVPGSQGRERDLARVRARVREAAHRREGAGGAREERVLEHRRIPRALHFTRLLVCPG